MVKTKVNWISATGEAFIFEYEARKHYGLSTVKDISGTIYHIKSVDVTNNDDEEKTKKRFKVEEKVGYLSGYELTRGSNGNKMFYDHAACVGGELEKFATTLYDEKGEYCQAPRGSPIRDVLCMDGCMFLLEFIEIKHAYEGIDLGINFLHEYLSLGRRIGLCVMMPWTISGNLRYQENILRLRESTRGMNENDKVDRNRRNTVKLRQQFSRMGFSAVANTSKFVDMWFLSMEKYNRMESADIKNGWLSREESRQLDVPMPVKRHVWTQEDKELERVLKSVMPDYDYYEDGGRTMNAMQQSTTSLQQSVSDLASFISAIAPTAGSSPSVQRLREASDRLGDIFPDTNSSRLTDEKKRDIRRLVEAGASLSGIEALNMAAQNYKNNDLFDLLIDEYGMDINATEDKYGRRPLHFAATSGKNVAAVRILLSKGADKTIQDHDGQTALEEMNNMEQNGMSMFCQNRNYQDTIAIRRLLTTEG